jgi:EAL domain-containing protein (putative c-di-GMP-specific phosphodiesterase class I)
MPFAENTELIHPLTEHVLRVALTQSASWERLGLRLDMAINASTRNLHDLHFPTMVAELLAEAGVSARTLEVEITENTVMADPVRSTTVLAELRAQGVRIAVDDFGTGYSSLAHLRDLTVDSVKIDKSFITDMSRNRSDRAITQAIVDLARNLDVVTVAEGIETTDAWDALKVLGCGYGQGYLIARPLPAAEMTAWVQALPCGAWQPETQDERL